MVIRPGMRGGTDGFDDKSELRMAGLIEVDQLTKTYSSGELSLTALRGVSLSIARTEFVAITGPSGSGKSTFMNILGCLDNLTSGRYLLDGTDIGSLNRDELAEIRNEKMGFVFQNYQLLPRVTALSNVELPLLYSRIPRREHRSRGMAALETVGMRDQAARLPNQLSGGQQQRIAIARAVVNNPELILADEPTGALDSRSGIEIMRVFQRLNREQRITVIVVTHEQEIAQCANRIIEFRDGLVVHDYAVRAVSV